MLHANRTWCVSTVESAEELATKLCETTWCCCTAFELDGYVFANDSTSPDGAQEYGVLKRMEGPAHYLQVESITFGWCNRDECLRHIQRTLAGEYDSSPFVHAVKVDIQTSEEHGRCGHCA